MKNIVLALVVAATGFANAQSSTSTAPATDAAAATSTTQVPQTPNKVKLSLDLEARAIAPQKNSALVEARSELDVYVAAKLNPRHSVAALATVYQKYDNKDETGSKQVETDIPFDPYIQYKYRVTHPDVKDHNSQIGFRYYAPTSAASVANKNDGSLRIKYDYTQVNNLGPVGLTVIYAPFFQKYFNEEVAFNAASPRSEFAFGNQFVLSWEYKKMYIENNLDLRILMPMRNGSEPAATAAASTLAYFDTYVGYYLNQANTISAFAMYYNYGDMVDGRGYEYPAFQRADSFYSVGLRGSF